MLGRASSRPENRPYETVTQRLERLRLEHRRHIRNTGNGTSRTLAQALVITGPSLPDVNLPTGLNALDNWNDDHAGRAIRPRPAQVLALNAVLNPPAREQVPVHGPPPARSWASPSNRTNGSSTRTMPRKPRARTIVKKGSKKTVPGMTVIERLRLEEDEALEKIYGDEYWFRSAGDVRWSIWREEALRLAFSYSVGSLEAGRQVLKENPFVPFERHSGDSRVPTLFENVLKFIFASPQDRHDEQHTEESLDSLELLQMLPPHIQKRVLRCVAAHRPLTSEQLRCIHFTKEDDSLSTQEVDLVDHSGLTELVLSGRKVEAALLGELLSTQKTREIPVTTDQISSVRAYSQSIVLFQTPFLQKRHLLSFPKTITTLGLVALPPPKGLRTHKAPTVSTAEAPVTAGCSCPWCASAETGEAGRINSGQDRCSSSSTLPALPTSALPYTSSALIPQLVALPELLPSLVVLDVSYNPWMSSDTVIRNSNQKEINRSRKGEQTEHIGLGILGTWDLRLWGRMNVLGIKGCFEHHDAHDNVERAPVPDILHAGFDPLVDSLALTEPCSCGISHEGWSQWRRRDALLEKWEKTAYAVGRTVEVIWREHECRCGNSAPIK